MSKVELATLRYEAKQVQLEKRHAKAENKKNRRRRNQMRRNPGSKDFDGNAHQRRVARRALYPRTVAE